MHSLTQSFTFASSSQENSNDAVGVSDVVNAFNLTRGSGLCVVLFSDDGVDTRAEIVGNSRLVVPLVRNL